MTVKPRVFVTQPIASRALDRLRAIANVKINTDSSKIIAKSKLIAAVKKCDVLFSLLHDRIDQTRPLRRINNFVSNSECHSILLHLVSSRHLL